MTFARRIIPDHFIPSDWDEAWARGWFRMRQTLFTTAFLEFDRQFHSAVWLRVDLGIWTGDHHFQNLQKRAQRFRVDVHPLDVKGPSDAHEALYQRYRHSLAFEPAPTLKDLLYGDSFQDRFPTWIIDLYDGDRLVASGIFDVGAKAAAGISCYYDPEYRKFSLGTYLIYKKMEYCREAGLEWFYPGYVAPGQPRFDYKWNLGAPHVEFLDLVTGAWVHHEPGDPIPDPLADMTERLLAVSPQVRRYLHLDINLNPQVRGMALFDYPAFVDCFSVPTACPLLVVVFDPRDDEYQLLHLRSVYHFDGVRSDDPGTGAVADIFESDLLFVERVLFRSSDPGDLAAVVAGFTVAQT